MKREVNVKEVWVKLQGGLGNQLFQYAFGNLIASKNNFELINLIHILRAFFSPT